jgi:hypothetical protein
MCCVSQQARGFSITATRSSSSIACAQHAQDAVLLQLNKTGAMLPVRFAYLSLSFSDLGSCVAFAVLCTFDLCMQLHVVATLLGTTMKQNTLCEQLQTRE